MGRLKNFFRERARRHISRTYGFCARLFRIWLLARVSPRVCGSPAFSPARAAPFACVPRAQILPVRAPVRGFLPPVRSSLTCAPPAYVPPACSSLAGGPRAQPPLACSAPRAAPSRNRFLLRREVVVHIPLICPEQILSWQISPIWTALRRPSSEQLDETPGRKALSTSEDGTFCPNRPYLPTFIRKMPNTAVLNFLLFAPEWKTGLTQPPSSHFGAQEQDSPGSAYQQCGTDHQD